MLRLSSPTLFLLLGTLAGFSPVRIASAVPDHLFQAPPVAPLGPTQIDVYPNGYRVVGQTFVPDAGHPLLRAIEAAEPIHAATGSPVVLTIHGVIPAKNGQQIGGGSAGLKPFVAYWKSFPIDVAVRGAKGSDVDELAGFGIGKNLTDGTVTPGVKRIRVENLSIRPSSYATSAISTPNGLVPTLSGNVYPLIQVYGCVVRKGSGKPHWGARLHGRARFDFRDTYFEPMVEHCVYADSPQGDSFFLGNRTEGTTRTMLQVVNRKTNPGPSGHGHLLIEDNFATNIDNDGGSDFTVAGHLGVVIFRRNVSFQGPWQTGAQGSIVVYSDDSPGHGVRLNANGYATNKVIVENHAVFAPNADRDHVMISGAEKVEIREAFYFIGNRTAFHFDAPYGGVIPNGDECFIMPPRVSVKDGFMSAFKAMRKAVPLSDVQLDALWCP